MTIEQSLGMLNQASFVRKWSWLSNPLTEEQDDYEQKTNEKYVLTQ